MMLDKFNLAGYFDAIQPGAHLTAKPAPDIFLQAAELLDQQPEQCVVIEDSLAGVQGGKNAGMQCVAVTSTFPREALTMADFVVDDYTGPLTPVLQTLQLL
jgi:beta-phosphoglucomutase-like phosphatase (HAD superfamily)